MCFKLPRRQFALKHWRAWQQQNVFDPGSFAQVAPNHPSHVTAVSLTVLHTAHEEDFHVSILICNQPRPL
jgi:hypothetical protein